MVLAHPVSSLYFLYNSCRQSSLSWQIKCGDKTSQFRDLKPDTHTHTHRIPVLLYRCTGYIHVYIYVYIHVYMYNVHIHITMSILYALHFVCTDTFVFFVKQARLCQSTEGSKLRNDVTRGLIQLKRDESTCMSVMQGLFTLSYEESSSELEEASRIKVLEERWAVCKFIYVYMYTHIHTHTHTHITVSTVD